MATEYSNEEIVASFLDHIRYLNIAHHVNGRIRVKASLSGARKLAEVEAGELERIISSIPGIEDYRVNKKALSVIINYNPQILPFSLWERVGQLKENPAGRESVESELLTILNEQ